MPWQLTEAAASDLTDIIEYTSEHWGEAQAIRYHAKILEYFERIGENPLLAASWSLADYLTGTRAIFVERHVIIYRQRGDVVERLRILHQRMQLSLHHLR